MAISLRTPLPKRLYFAEGRWALEVERYLPIEPRVFRPRVETVVGEARIARVLREANDGEMAESTLALVHANQPGEWEVVSGEWMRCD